MFELFAENPSLANSLPLSLSLEGLGTHTEPLGNALGYRGVGPGGGGSALGIGGLGTHGTGKGTGGFGALTLAPQTGKVDTRTSEQKYRDRIEITMRRANPQFKYAYEKYLQANPSLEGRITLRFTINTQGRAENITAEKVSGFDSKYDEVADSLIRIVQTLNFTPPPPMKGAAEAAPVDVTYPFAFCREGPTSH